VKRDDFLHNGAAAAVSAPDFGFGGWYNDRSIIAALFFATDELRRRICLLQAGRSFLNLRGLLFQGCRENLHILFLLHDSGFQFLHFAMLFQELVE
jgi:hypothetical protein